MMSHRFSVLVGLLLLWIGGMPMGQARAEDTFTGRFYAGKGDVEYLQLLDIARRMWAPDPEFQSVPMLYTPQWNGLVEGPTWGAWWIQNSYGSTYCALPFIEEPVVSFLQNSQDLWFDQMGDGKRIGGQNWQAPDGCLCDAASPGWVYYKQGDGRIDIHDWGMEFTAAGLVMQAELLLISRDPQAIAHYLPMLERVANFIETRRDPKNDCFLAGPAGNLLAPSYAGWKRPDGSYGRAYLTGLSVTYIAGLDRLIELEKLAGNTWKAELYAERRARAHRGLMRHLTTEEGYLIKSLDPDGTRHGVYGAPKHGYFEAVCNHDAICFRVTDDAQSRRIYDKLASIPGLRPHGLIITNYPSLDDLYTEPTGLWEFGRWVNGGHWSTCEARAMMAYYRLGKHDDVRRSMEAILRFARQFRMDNPLIDFGANVYQPNEPINTVYDSYGIPAAMVRGLFEYLYRAEGLTLVPHLPPGITELQQLFPIRFGRKRLYLSTAGSGPITGVRLNGQPWKRFDATSVSLPYDETPEVARLTILMGGARAPRSVARPAPPPALPTPSASDPPVLADLNARAGKLAAFSEALQRDGLGDRYEAAHARLAVEWIAMLNQRQRLQAEGKLLPLAAEAQAAAEELYRSTASKLCDGLGRVLLGYRKADDPTRQRIYRLWLEHADAPGWFNVRAMGQAQSFLREGECLRMSVAGKPESSCGWARDLDEPITIPAGARLVVELRGSEGARFFVDLMGLDGNPVFQTQWQDSPREMSEVSFPLEAGVQVGQAILYTANVGAEAHNDFRRVIIEVPGQAPLARFLVPSGPTARSARDDKR